jgi:hypothetical protein
MLLTVQGYFQKYGNKDDKKTSLLRWKVPYLFIYLFVAYLTTLYVVQIV